MEALALAAAAPWTLNAATGTTYGTILFNEATAVQLDALAVVASRRRLHKSTHTVQHDAPTIKPSTGFQQACR